MQTGEGSCKRDWPCPLQPPEPFRSLAARALCRWDRYHQGEKGNLTGTSTSYARVPISATRACFWGTGSSYLCLLFRCSQYTCSCLVLVCLFQPQRGMELWITARGWCGHFCFHFTKENERTHILKRSANISPDFFSSTVKLKMKEKDAGSATANTTVT